MLAMRRGEDDGAGFWEGGVMGDYAGIAVLAFAAFSILAGVMGK